MENQTEKLTELKDKLRANENTCNAYINVVDCKYEDSFMLFDIFIVYYKDNYFTISLDTLLSQDIIIEKCVLMETLIARLESLYVIND